MMTMINKGKRKKVNINKKIKKKKTEKKKS